MNVFDNKAVACVQSVTRWPPISPQAVVPQTNQYMEMLNLTTIPLDKLSILNLTLLKKHHIMCKMSGTETVFEGHKITVNLQFY